MTTLEFISELIGYFVWPVLILILVYWFRDPLLCLLSRLKEIRHGDTSASFQTEEEEESSIKETTTEASFSIKNDKLIEDLRSILLNGPHSFDYLRRKTPIKLTDEKFETLIKEQSDIFQHTSMKNYNENKERIYPGKPGIKLVPYKVR